jgi:hypothetical protein
MIKKRNQNGILLDESIIRKDMLSCGRVQSYFLASQNWGVFILYKNNRVIMTDAVVQWQNL